MKNSKNLYYFLVKFELISSIKIKLPRKQEENFKKIREKLRSFQNNLWKVEKIFH